MSVVSCVHLIFTGQGSHNKALAVGPHLLSTKIPPHPPHLYSVCVIQSAVGHDYQSKLSKHCSQVDTSKGFGGKFGVQADRVDQV